MCLYLNWTEPRDHLEDHLDLRLNDIHIFYFKISTREMKRNEDMLFFSLGKARLCNNT